VLSMLEDTKQVNDAFLAGADAYLLKSIDNAEIAFAIHMVLRGSRYMSTELVERLLLDENKSTFHLQSVPTDFELSMRELEVLELIGEGYTNLQIADRLFISKRTVEGHRQALLDKAGAPNTAALVRFAVKCGLL
ncbi:MAG: response regulator transcription factor, partial [Pedobacter sp.]